MGFDTDLLEISVPRSTDNIDHTLITFGSKRTFHGKDVIASVTLADN